jgi:predicted nucleic acid-binding protein
MADRCVLDASVALAGFLDDTPEREERALDILFRIEDGSLAPVVPALFHAEVAAVLLKARRNPALRFDAGRLARALDTMEVLPLETYPIVIDARALVGLATRHQLQAYDSVYFALAQAMGLPVAALDGGLNAAAVAAGVGVVA